MKLETGLHVRGIYLRRLGVFTPVGTHAKIRGKHYHFNPISFLAPHKGPRYTDGFICAKSGLKDYSLFIEARNKDEYVAAMKQIQDNEFHGMFYLKDSL